MSFFTFTEGFTTHVQRGIHKLEFPFPSKQSTSRVTNTNEVLHLR